MQPRWTHKAGISSGDKSQGVRHQLPSRPAFIQTLRTSAAYPVHRCGGARWGPSPKKPQQPPASQICPLSPGRHEIPMTSATHLQPRSPGQGGSRERWARGPLGGAGARGSPCPRAGGARSRGFGGGAEAALRGSDRREREMGTDYTQAAGVPAGRVIKGRARPPAPLHPAPPPRRPATPRPPARVTRLRGGRLPVNPHPCPASSHRKLRDPERGDSPVIQPRRGAPSCPFGAGGSRCCREPGCPTDPRMTSLGGFRRRKESRWRDLS